jgi:hypothetical protein
MTPFLAAFGAVHAPGALGLGVMLYALWERRQTIAAMFTRAPSTTRVPEPEEAAVTSLLLDEV